MKKNWIVIVSSAAAIISCWLLVRKNQQAEEARARAAAAEEERNSMATQMAQEEKKSGRLRAQLHETRSEAAEKAIEADKLKQRLSRSEAEALQEMKSRLP